LKSICALACVALLFGIALAEGPERVAKAKRPAAARAEAAAAQIVPSVATPTEVDRLIAQENADLKVPVADTVDDLAFLRRVSVDLVGRIPSEDEIQEFLALPAEERRNATIDRLLADPRFNDRWTVFYSDMLRVRYYADGGAQLTAFIHQAVEEGLPYDELVRRLLAANGKAGKVPEVGFILGDAADPMALAGVTSQVFMGIRISCAQCHDHPFDVWTREQFYGLAAYFGKTQRVESQLTRAVYTTEMVQTTVLWPPEDKADGQERTPMTPSFPFALESAEDAAAHVARLTRLRAELEAAANQVEGPSVDDLLADAGDRAEQATDEEDLPEGLDVVDEAKREAAALRVQDDLYRASQLRRELSEFITSPRNTYFSRSFVNRVWKELVGRGFVEPIDDFSAENAPSHPQTLDYLADEFVAGGFDLRQLVRSIVTSQAYQRGRLADVDEKTRQDAEAAFASAPVRRMIGEALFDSIIQAGHLFELKWPAGANLRTVRTLERVAMEDALELDAIAKLEGEEREAAMAAQRASMPAPSGGYDLESAIEVDFDDVLMASAEEPAVDEMAVMSDEEIEAAMMTNEAMQRTRYVERWVESEVDDNPRFSSAMRMASPADPAHFLRVFGQPARELLGEHRDESASMRQALMMLNGRLTHEASRVGDFEPMHKLVAGRKADLEKAVELAYREILTRAPSAEERAEAREIIDGAADPSEGMADLRWVLFNCHEFRFLP
jgi:hypothetical protein